MSRDTLVNHSSGHEGPTVMGLEWAGPSAVSRMVHM